VYDRPAARFGAVSPVAHGLAVAQANNVPWLVVLCGSQIRLYSARPDVGVGRKGQTETFTEIDLALLPEDDAAYLTLLYRSTPSLPAEVWRRSCGPPPTTQPRSANACENGSTSTSCLTSPRQSRRTWEQPASRLWPRRHAGPPSPLHRCLAMNAKPGDPTSGEQSG
jgi:hypothetical protein